MALADSARSLTPPSTHHYPEPQPNEMALGTKLTHYIKEMRILLIEKKLSKAERSSTRAHG